MQHLQTIVGGGQLEKNKQAKGPSSLLSLGMISRFSSKLKTTNLKFLLDKHIYMQPEKSGLFC